MLQQIDNAIAFSVVMLMLSLIVTAVVQAISAVLDLRGKNLASGLANLFHQIEPELRKPLPGGLTIAEHIANVVVKHPAIAHAGTRAKAVSQSELMRVLRDLCSDHPAADINSDAKIALKKLLDERVPGGDETVAAAQAVAQQLATAMPGQDAQVKAAVQAAFATVSKLESQIGQWFDTVMNRLSDIFTRKTRAITVVMSVLLVIALQIDSGEILQQIIRSPELRAKLTGMSDTTMSQADKIFDNSERAAAALSDVKKNHSGDAQIVAALDKMPPHLTRCVDGKNALVENTKNLANAGMLLDEFDKACQDETRQAMGSSYDEIRGLRADLAKTDLNIIPAQIGGTPVFDTSEHWWAAWKVRRHRVGALASIIFLSLGAPFWFNALRQLSNLKPAIAGKVADADQDEDSKA